MPAVELRHVSHRYPTGRLALSDVSLAVEPGERIALIGPSGAGKSTLLRCVNGLITPTEGDAQVLGERISALSEPRRARLRRRIGMIFQEFALVERLPVLTNVLVGRLGYTSTIPSLVRIFPPGDVEGARKGLEEVGLAGYEDRLVRLLSGGQKQRVGIARALVQGAEIILGDEPTANLDVRTADEVLSLLVALATERRVTLILSLHDVRAARRYCERIVGLKDGALAWDGSAAAFGEREAEDLFYS